MSEIPRALCAGCNRRPEEIREYRDGAMYSGLTPDDFVYLNEGTYNPDNGHFLCTDCYVKAGSPSSPDGWIAP